MVYKDCCSIYVAYGFEYFMMAVNSARSLKKNNPGLPIILITNVSIDNPTIDDELLFHEVIYRKENTDKNRIEKISVDLYSPFLKTVYLDCDTEVYGDLSLVFRALDRFDIAIRQSPIPTNKRIKVMNDLFAHDLRMPSWNAGVIFFHKNERSEKLFVRWREIYLKEGMRQDQPSLMRAIIETEDLRLLNLSAAWNAKPISTHELNWLYKGIDDIIILHYRRPYLIPSIAKNINDLFSAVNHRFQIRGDDPVLQREIARFSVLYRVYTIYLFFFDNYWGRLFLINHKDIALLPLSYILKLISIILKRPEIKLGRDKKESGKNFEIENS